LQVGSTDNASPLVLRAGVKTDATAANRYGAIEVDDAGLKRNLALQANGGNVGIGTSSPTSKLDVVGNTSILGTAVINAGSTFPGVHVLSTTSSFYGGNMVLGINFPASLAGDVLGSVSFGDNQGSAAQTGIYAHRDAASSGAADLPTRLVFYTTPDGSGSMSERMRIDNAGRVGIGSSAPKSNLTVHNVNDANLTISTQGVASSDDIAINLQTQNDAGGTIQFGTATTTKGWTFGARGNAWGVAAEQNMAFLSYFNGTTWNQPLNLLPNGNIGVGNVNPTAKLDVTTSTSLASTNDVVGINSDITGSGGARVIGLYGWARGAGASGKSYGVVGIADYTNTPTDGIGVLAAFNSTNGSLPTAYGFSGALVADGNNQSYAGVFMNGAVAIGEGYAGVNAKLNIKDGHIQSRQTTGPTAAVSAAAGTSASVSVVGTDVAGKVTLTAGTGAYATGTQCTITFNKSFASSTPRVVITPANANAGVRMNTCQAYVLSTATTFTINFNIAINAPVTMEFNYIVIDN